MKSKRHLCKILGSILFLSATMNAGAQGLDSETKAALLSGNLKLSIAIFNSMYQGHDTTKRLLDEGKWEELASNVISKKAPLDLYYYLLGRSAEGLGAPDAARIYYKQALISGAACKSYLFGDGCMGLDVLRLASERQVALALLEKKPKIFDLAFLAENLDVKDDELEVNATITSSTAHALIGEMGPTSRHIRAFVDKQTLKATYQVYVNYLYREEGFRSYNIAKFIGADGVRATPVVNIGKNVDCNNRQENQCLFTETIGFEPDEKTVADLASKHKADEMGAWKFRISAKSGHDLNVTVPYAEFRAVYERVSRYIDSKKAK